MRGVLRGLNCICFILENEEANGLKQIEQNMILKTLVFMGISCIILFSLLFIFFFMLEVFYNLIFKSKWNECNALE